MDATGQYVREGACPLHPYLTPATRKLVIDAGLELEAGFWTYNSSHWALVNTQFKNTKIALAQHGCPLTPSLVAHPPDYVAEFDRLTNPHSNLTVHQAADNLGWTVPAAYTCCWWGKVQGGPCRNRGYRYHGGQHPRLALNNYIRRQVQMDAKRNTAAIYIPWWGAGMDYSKIMERRFPRAQ